MIHGYRFSALGCSGRIRIANVARPMADQAVTQVVSWLRRTEAELSRFVAHSLVSRVNRGDVVTISPAFASVLTAARRAYDLTAGRFSISAAPLWQLWHDPQRTLWPTAQEIANAQKYCVANPLHISDGQAKIISENGSIDLGGIGKEWCVDQLISQLTAAGLTDVLVELGGDCAARGCQPQHDGWQVLLPGIAAAITLRNEAIATSGIGTRGRSLAGTWIPHLINAESGHPAAGMILSASVIAADCVDAGIRATDLCLLEQTSVLLMSVRSGGLPMWLRLPDNKCSADQQMAQRLRPVVIDQAA